VIKEADSALVSKLFPSPNFEPRLRGLTPSMLILHYTGLPTVEKSLEILSRPDCKVSCHYVVDETGRVIQMVPENMRAWHAGLSVWRGEMDINSASIGIEIQNPGHAHGYPEFPEEQMKAVLALSKDISERHGIASHRVLAHSDVAPARKIDPGEKFDWSYLARSGVGFWVPPVAADPDDQGLDLGSQDLAVAQAQSLLAHYGYGIEKTGVLDDATSFVLRAFQLHFRPERVDGRLDRSTLATLERLVDALVAPPTG
jgi:N-acetylmuramoyl-L-alanine amidase